MWIKLAKREAEVFDARDVPPSHQRCPHTIVVVLESTTKEAFDAALGCSSPADAAEASLVVVTGYLQAPTVEPQYHDLEARVVVVMDDINTTERMLDVLVQSIVTARSRTYIQRERLPQLAISVATSLQ